MSLDEPSAFAYGQLAHALAMQGAWTEAVQCDRRSLEITSGAAPPQLPADIDPPVHGKRRDGIPIITIYRELGLRPKSISTLAYAVAQAIRISPRSPVIVIGDGSNRYDFLEHHLILDHATEAEDFAKVYRHVAFPTRYDFMLFSFQRWFVLMNFMQRHGLESCLHIDPDVLLLRDLNELSLPANVEISLSATTAFGVSPHYNLVTNRVALERYCSFVLEMYSPRPSITVRNTSMHAKIAEGKRAYVTDMHAFAEFWTSGGARVANLSAIIGGETWDANIASPDGFRFRRCAKAIDWVDGAAYCKLVSTGQRVRFNALHFNSTAKSWMPDGFHQRPFGSCPTPVASAL